MAQVTQQNDSLRISAEPACAPAAQNALMLRPGRGAPLFLFSGGGADLRELDSLVRSLSTRRPLIGIRYWETADAGPPTTVEAMADAALKSMRLEQRSGPYIVAGYSLGGLVALEVARRLIEQGESVRPPILIDALTHRSAWPWPILARAGLRYVIQRAFHGNGAGSETALAQNAAGPVERCREARAKYRPAPYEGRIAFINASREPYIGGLAPAIWRKLALSVDCYAVEARHLDLMRVEATISKFAKIVDELVDNAANDPNTRRALVVTGLSWESTARLAGELIRVGFTVEVLGPARHPVTLLSGLTAFHILSPFNPLRSIEAAMKEIRPDVIIPGDDFVADLLHRLYTTTKDLGVRALLEKSLGNPEFFAHRLDRQWMIAFAARAGVSVPATVEVKAFADLDKQLEAIGSPAFLKVDGSWGGMGVARVSGLVHARQAWRRLSSPIRYVRAIKRAVFNGDLSGIDGLLRRRRAIFSLQATQDGQLVIVSAVCHRGELLGMFGARVLSQQGAFGRAKAIQIDDGLPVREAVAKIVRRLGLSGLCGFDFILPATGEARFVELNPRVTQTSTLISARDGDALASLLDALGGRGQPRSETLASGTVVTVG